MTDSLVLRILQFFFGCSHHAVVAHERAALISIARCQRRAFHKGPHQYPAGWTAYEEARK